MDARPLAAACSLPHAACPALLVRCSRACLLRRLYTLRPQRMNIIVLANALMAAAGAGASSALPRRWTLRLRQNMAFPSKRPATNVRQGAQGQYSPPRDAAATGARWGCAR